MNRWKRPSDRSGRAPLHSPGRPPVAAREERRRFWAAIAAGLSSEDAAAAGPVPQAVGARWFRKAGGMPPAMFGPSAKPLSGRYLSFAEREEIALLRAQGCTMQEVARRIGRAASTISRELRRNAATRSGGLEYRATTAQWHRAIGPSTKAGEAGAERGLAGLCAGTTGGPRRSSERRRPRSRPRRTMEGATAWTAAGLAMGARLEP